MRRNKAGPPPDRLPRLQRAAATMTVASSIVFQCRHVNDLQFRFVIPKAPPPLLFFRRPCLLDRAASMPDLFFGRLIFPGGLAARRTQAGLVAGTEDHAAIAKTRDRRRLLHNRCGFATNRVANRFRPRFLPLLPLRRVADETVPTGNLSQAAATQTGRGCGGHDALTLPSAMRRFRTSNPPPADTSTVASPQFHLLTGA